MNYSRILQIIQPFTPGWKLRALTCSALEGEGMDQIWKVICEFREQISASGVFQQRRSQQSIEWFRTRVRQTVMQRFECENSQHICQLETAVGRGELSVSEAVDQLLGEPH